VTGVAIVTGSDSGIGRATALALARDGFGVGVTWHTDTDGAAETLARVRAIGGHGESTRLDLASGEGAAAAIRDLAQRLGGLDVLVNNAGANHRATLLGDTLAGWRRALEVNLTGPFVCAQEAAQHMVETGRGGRIVNVTSVHEHQPLRWPAALLRGRAAQRHRAVHALSA
jgi:NAD(P)-dependent dehydrogenase (short-subunit alcohol dehydrogenase family)